MQDDMRHDSVAQEVLKTNPTGVKPPMNNEGVKSPILLNAKALRIGFSGDLDILISIH
jgi:hypothetical protein